MRAIAVLTVLALAPAAAGQQANEAAREPLTCTAFAVSTGGLRSSPVATTLDIVVNRWSSKAQHERLVEALMRSQDAMLETLRDMPRLGYIRRQSSLGWDLHYAHARPEEEGGQRVVIATDRPIGFSELTAGARTLDYPFTFIELRLNGEGEGTGTLSYATQVYATNEGRLIQLENYATQPIQLNDVTCRRPVEPTRG